MTHPFSTTVAINATPATVWTVLTSPAIMATWMGEPDMNLAVHTNWAINTPIVITGFHHVQFENKGLVLQFDRERQLTYTHLSSVSRLADEPQHYSILAFALTTANNTTQLTLTINNFPTETIRRHLEFYWRTTMVKIKYTSEAQIA